MRDVQIVRYGPRGRMFVYAKSQLGKDRSTLYVGGSRKWKQQRDLFEYVSYALSHESTHLVITKLAPRLAIGRGELKGTFATDALDGINMWIDGERWMVE